MRYKQIVEEHTKKLPCFICIVRSFCAEFREDGSSYIKNEGCEKFGKWKDVPC